MSLTFNPLSSADYKKLVFQMLKAFEGPRSYAYNDTNHHPTIGIGFEISANAQYVLEGMGYSAASFTNPDKFNNFANALRDVGKKTFPNSGEDGESAELQAAINEVANKYLGMHYGEINKKSGKTNPNFDYGSNTGGSGLSADDQMEATFNLIEGTYETTLDSWLQGVQIPDSTERAALLSLTYNNLIGFKANGQLKSPHLHAAILSDNRAEAWYEIRYQSNGNGLTGIAKRRYDEAAMFGLYNVSGVTAADALQIYQMCTTHGLDSMLRYDEEHTRAMTLAENIGYLGTTYPKPEALYTTLLPAAEELSAVYGAGQNFDPMDIFAARSGLEDAISAQVSPNHADAPTVFDRG